MEKLKALATKRIAGIPVIAFIALFMAGLLWYAIKLKPTEPDVITDATAPEGDGDLLGDTSQPVFSATPTIMQPSGGSVTATPMADTNDLYARRAIEWLIAQGKTYDVAKATLDKWLDGESLTIDEDKIRSLVIAHFGIPPEDVVYAPVIPKGGFDGNTDNPGPFKPDKAGGGTGPYNPGEAASAIDDIYSSDTRAEPPVLAPPSAPTPPAVKQGAVPIVHVVTGNGDTSYRDLAMLYYGSTGFDAVQRMKAQDRNIGKDGPFAKGTHIKVPKQNPDYFTATNSIRTAGAIAAKNGITVQQLNIMNPQTNFPVKAGTRVQVG